MFSVLAIAIDRRLPVDATKMPGTWVYWRLNERMSALLERPTEQSIHELLVAAARRNPQARATADQKRSLSYGELAGQVDLYAKSLLSLGIGRGDRLAMLTPPAIDFWVVCHAAVSIGAIWLGINPRYKRRDFEHVLLDSEPAALIVCSPFEGRDYCAELRPLLDPVTPMICRGEPSAGAKSQAAFLARGAAISDSALAAARASVRPEDPAIIVYTSGTTGKPKGAMLSHRAIVSSAVANARWMGEAALASCVCAAPVNHVGAINNICMTVLAAAGTVIFHPRVDLAALAELSRRERPTYMVQSPTGFAMLLAGPGGGADWLEETKLTVFGGAKTAKSMLEQIAPFGGRLSSVFGQTETCGTITRTDDGASLDVLSQTVGKPIAGAELRITGPDDQAAAPGEVGEIQFRAPYLMSGYFRNPQATAEAFTTDGFLRTGDLGLVNVDGDLIFVGRLKEMFKSGGYNIYPVEIEQAICEHPAVALAAVVAIDHPTYQEVGFAFVEPAPGASVTAGELHDFLNERIANYKIPKHFQIEAELPKLPNLKIDKVALRSLVSN
jgi:acyl-CoA synthetase (AMP-forming)/AMP-acid ligase II